ncbi:MAG TPA: SGNH/GDSL hydrolase family protein [bacterium]
MAREPDSPSFQYRGRIDFTDRRKPRMIGAGAFVRFRFKGNACSVLLVDQNANGNRSYVSFELDGRYIGRIQLVPGRTRYVMAEGLDNAPHTVLLCKATEAMIGWIDFLGVECGELLSIQTSPERVIECIGNSITCGTGLDASNIPCDSGAWYDQHNAYLGYGPLLARALNADWVLSSVSGMGMIRNWNSPGPVMSDVYDKLYLNAGPGPLWDGGKTVPDLVTICLGTNDFSDGDGTVKRAPVDSAEFVERTIRFIRHIRNLYPDAQLVCLNSPTVSGEKGAKLTSYLSTAVRSAKDKWKDKKINLFVFSRSYSAGCAGHPNRKQHEQMAGELEPFVKKVINW